MDSKWLFISLEKYKRNQKIEMLFGLSNECTNKGTNCERKTMNTNFSAKSREKKEKAAGPEASLAEKKAPYYNIITRFLKCDILLHNNDVEVHGFEKTKSEGEMIDLAVKNDCRIIIKNGTNGKWYLKGKGKPIEYLKSKIDERLGKSRDGVFCLLLE
jgi:hypothetical protein